jgi:hypothetical protein
MFSHDSLLSHNTANENNAAMSQSKLQIPARMALKINGGEVRRKGKTLYYS